MTQETQTLAWQKTAVLSNIEAAADGISTGFCWNDTPEGHDYWEKVYDTLYAMVEALRAAEARKDQKDEI